MRTNIEIDDNLMAEAMKAMGTKTKRETVEKALKAQVSQRRKHEILELCGNVDWVGDLDDWRRE